MKYGTCFSSLWVFTKIESIAHQRCQTQVPGTFMGAQYILISSLSLNARTAGGNKKRETKKKGREGGRKKKKRKGKLIYNTWERRAIERAQLLEHSC